MVLSSSRCLSPLRAAAQGSAYLLTHLSWTSRIGTGFRKCSFSRPRRRVTTSPASSSTRRCFMTPKRVIGNRASSALSDCPSSSNNASRRLRRVGSASALKNSSMPRTIRDQMVTCQVQASLAAVSTQGVSHISKASADRVEVRGRDLTGDLMGRLSFTEYFHLLLTGDEPTEDQRFFLDLLLVAIAEHGLMPTNVAARMTLAADPGSLQGAVAAGILGCGPVVLGTSELCARLLEEGRA